MHQINDDDFLNNAEIDDEMNTIYWYIFYYFTNIYFFAFLITLSYKFDSQCFNLLFNGFSFFIILLSLGVFISQIKKITNLRCAKNVIFGFFAGSIIGSLITGFQYVLLDKSSDCAILDYIVGIYVFFWFTVVGGCIFMFIGLIVERLNW